MAPSRRSLARLFAALAVSCVPVHAQERVDIEGEDTYCECRVTLEHVITLGDEQDGTIRGEVRQVGVNSAGVYHVLAWRDFQVSRFDRTGQPLRPLFVEGSGPMETASVEAFDIVAGDTLVVVDGGNGRIVVVSPDAAEARTMPVAGYTPAIAHVPGSGTFINHRGFSPETLGMPLHWIGPSGRPERSFGGPTIPREELGLTWTRNIAVDAESLWSAPDHAYELQLWSAQGERLSTIRRHMAGFEPRTEAEWGGPSEPYKPRIVGIEVDRRGYLMVAMKRGGPDWAERLPPARQQANGVVYPIPPGIGLFETVLEVLDPHNGQLFARGVADVEVHGFVDNEHVFSYEEDEMGRPTVSIWRLGLSSRP